MSEYLTYLIFKKKKTSKHLSFEIDLLRPYGIKTVGNIYQMGIKVVPKWYHAG